MTTKHPVAVRARILKAALEVLRAEGPLALTQPRVARRAGVKQGHLTYYFPTRSDLLSAVAEAATETLVAEYDAVLAAATGGAAGRAAKAGAVLHSPERTRMLLSFVLAADGEPPIRALFRRLTATIRARLVDGLTQVGIPPRRETVAMVHALCVGLAVLDLARGESEATEEIGATLAAALRALRSAAAAAPSARLGSPRRKRQ